jgi:hypothetical protein
MGWSTAVRQQHEASYQRTKLFEPEYMTVTNKKLIGNHALASATSKFRNDIIRSFFTDKTQKTQTEDWMHKSKKFMSKLRPETTYCTAVSASFIAVAGDPTRENFGTHFVDYGHKDRRQAVAGNRQV